MGGGEEQYFDVFLNWGQNVHGTELAIEWPVPKHSRRYRGFEVSFFNSLA